MEVFGGISVTRSPARLQSPHQKLGRCHSFQGKIERKSNPIGQMKRGHPVKSRSQSMDYLLIQDSNRFSKSDGTNQKSIKQDFMKSSDTFISLGNDIYPDSSSATSKDYNPETILSLQQEFKNDLSEIENTYDLVEVFYKYREAPEEVIQECVQEISIVKYNLNDINIRVFRTIISRCKQLESLKLEYCGEPDDLKFFLSEIKKKKCEIAEIHIWGMVNLKVYCKALFDLVIHAGTKILEICSVNMQFEDLDEMRKVVMDIPSTSKIQLKTLNLSYNKFTENIAQLGKIIRSPPVRNIALFNCDLDDKKVETFCQFMDGKKIETVDLSGNTNITPKGFETIGKWIGSEEITHISLRCCDIDSDKLNALLNASNATTKLTMLDVSYNEPLGASGMSALGSTVTKFNIVGLHIAGCNLNAELIKTFRKAIEDNQTLKELNVSDNRSLYRGIDEIAKIINFGSLKSLDMSCCLLTKENIHVFERELNNTASVESVNLSEKYKVLTEEYATAIAEQILPHVSDTLILKFKSVKPTARTVLRSKLEKISNAKKPVIYFGDEDTIPT